MYPFPAYKLTLLAGQGQPMQSVMGSMHNATINHGRTLTKLKRTTRATVLSFSYKLLVLNGHFAYCIQKHEVTKINFIMYTKM